MSISCALLTLTLGLALSTLADTRPKPRPADAGDNPHRIAIVHGHAGGHTTAAQALAHDLRNRGLHVQLLTIASANDPPHADLYQSLDEFRPDVVATGGTLATTRVLDTLSDVPVVYFMVPNIEDAAFLHQNRAQHPRIAGVTSDVHPDKLLQWTCTTRPGLRKLAVPCSDATRRTVQRLARAARPHNVCIKPVPAELDAFPNVITELQKNNCDGVLMLPDANVYNSPNVQRLLLWGARNQKPVWTFSANVVRAGAFAGHHVDAADIGRQAAEIIHQVLGGQAPGTIGVQYAAKPQRYVNVHTASLIDTVVDIRDLPSDTHKIGDDR